MHTAACKSTKSSIKEKNLIVASILWHYKHDNTKSSYKLTIMITNISCARNLIIGNKHDKFWFSKWSISYLFSHICQRWWKDILSKIQYSKLIWTITLSSHICNICMFLQKQPSVPPPAANHHKATTTSCYHVSVTWNIPAAQEISLAVYNTQSNS